MVSWAIKVNCDFDQHCLAEYRKSRVTSQRNVVVGRGFCFLGTHKIRERSEHRDKNVRERKGDRRGTTNVNDSKSQ